MKTIKLYGHLGKKFGRKFAMDVKSPLEAVRALNANFPEFGKYLFEHSEPGYRVLVDNDATPLEYLHLPRKGSTIKIVPVIMGSGKSPLAQIIIGAALIAIAVYSGGAGAPALFGSTIAGSIAVSVGVSLIIGGVGQLLAGKPPQPASTLPSSVFNGAVNTTSQGNPAPVCYGRLIVGSQVVSSGLSAEQVSTT